MNELTVDQLRTVTHELGRRDPRFVRVASTNVEEGSGTYEMRGQFGTGTLAFTFDVTPLRVLTPLFDEAQRAMLAASAAHPPDPTVPAWPR
jgi:hypothetical protein